MGRRECQILWIGPWKELSLVSEVIHPRHAAYGDGFELAGEWLHSFWLYLAERECGVRAQVHTHPRAAFHSPTDDHWPIVHMPGFLSLVIPDFGMGPVGLEGAYLAEIQPDGRWSSVLPHSRLTIA
jgi:hypothetical protein